MGEEQSEGPDTEKKKKRKKHELLKPPSFSVCEILHFGTHFQAKVKKTKQNVELALPKDFAILIILPKRQAPEGQSVPQASSAPPFSTLQLACNGLVVPPPPTESPGRAKLRWSAAPGAPGLYQRTPSPRLAACLPPGPLTSAARGDWLRRHCAPNMAAADEAAHIRREEGGRAGASEKGAPPPPRSPCRCCSLLPTDAESPRPPHPDSYPLNAYLKKREREKERYLSPSKRDAKAPTIPRSNGAGKRWRQQQQPKNSLSREFAPTHLGSSFGARQAPPPPPVHFLGCGRCSVILEPADGGK